MEISRFLIATDRPLDRLTKIRGGVELEDDALTVAARSMGLDAHKVSTDDLEAYGAGPDTVVFFQKQGRLSRQHAMLSTTLLASGAWIFEKNVFALPSRWRPQHERYCTILMSKDGWERLAYRSKAASFAIPTNALILSNPQLIQLPTMRTQSAGAIRLLRIGRPDPIKWSNFELAYSKAVASVRPETEIELIRVGCPDEVRLGMGRIPKNLAVRDFPYSADIANAYGNADVYLHHSRIGETFGNTVSEARAAGLPVILATSLRWDCASVELLDDQASLYGSPAQLVKNPQASMIRALGVPVGPSSPPSPKSYVESLLDATNTTRRRVSVNHSVGMRRHLSALKRGSQWMGDQSTALAMSIEALRARRTRGLADE